MNTKQPEALRLAKMIEHYNAGVMSQKICEDYLKAAAELRRLHAENERLRQINQSHEMKLSVRGYEIQIADLEAQRDALLEALREYRAAILFAQDKRALMSAIRSADDKALAAIAKVEGEQT